MIEEKKKKKNMHLELTKCGRCLAQQVLEAGGP